MSRIVVSILFSALLLSPLIGWAANSSENWRNLSPKEKDKVLQNYQRWQNLPRQDNPSKKTDGDGVIGMQSGHNVCQLI
jgi:hypothetical protein